MPHFRSHTCKLGTMIAMVLIYFVVELVVGYSLHSITLIADSFHMLSDFIALIIGIAARRISKWPKSSKNTFGWQRAEVVGTLLNTVMLTTLTCTILIETIKRFITPETIERPQLLFGVGAGGLVINIIGLIILGDHHGHSHGGDATMEALIKDKEEEEKPKKEKNQSYVDAELTAINISISDETKSGHGHSHESGHGHSHSEGKSKGHSHGSGQMNLKAVFLHVLADFFGSVAVVVSALVIWLVPGNGPWKQFIDPSISLFMVVLILLSTIPLLKKSALILLQSVPKEISVSHLHERMEQIEGIEKVHDLHVWLLQSDVIIGTVHIRCSNENYVTVSKKAKKLFHDFNIHCTTIQPEFDEHVEDSRSNSVEGSEIDQCVLFCDEKSAVTGSNECKAKQSCCPTRQSSVVATSNGSSRPVETEGPTVVRVLPHLTHQQSAPCLTSYDRSSDQNALAVITLGDVTEKL